MDNLEETIISNLLFNDEYARKSCIHLKENYFQFDHARTAFRLFWKYFNARGKVPTVSELKVELETAKNLKQHTFKDTQEFLRKLKPPKKAPNLQWLLEKTEEFCKQRAIYNIIASAAEKIDGKPEMLGDIPEKLQEALGITFDNKIGQNYGKDVEERFELLYRNKDTRIPFDLRVLNKIFAGGMTPKTLNVVAAGTGAGKTLFLCHLAKHLFTTGYKVLYITLEMAEERICERIDANLMDTSLADLPLLDKIEYVRRWEKGAGKKRGQLFVKEYPTCGANVGHFRALLHDLKLKKDFVPDVLIVDYVNIVASQRNVPMGNSYQYVKSVCEELRGLAIEFQIPVFSSTQFNRGGTDAADVGFGDISESHGLSMTVDVLLGMVRTEELDGRNLVMFKQLKNRFSDITENKRFYLKVDRSKMRLTDCTGAEEASADPNLAMIGGAKGIGSQSFRVGKSFKI